MYSTNVSRYVLAPRLPACTSISKVDCGVENYRGGGTLNSLKEWKAMAVGQITRASVARYAGIQSIVPTTRYLIIKHWSKTRLLVW
jgi:hypothetical protein